MRVWCVLLFCAISFVSISNAAVTRKLHEQTNSPDKSHLCTVGHHSGLPTVESSKEEDVTNVCQEGVGTILVVRLNYCFS